MTTARALLLSTSIAMGGSGCENPLCFVGDPKLAPEIELVFLDAAGERHALADGAEIPLVVPGQGGQVLLIGVRARNMDVCALQGSVAVHDECAGSPGGNGRIIGREGRPLSLNEREDGWAAPGPQQSAYANIPACPNAASSRDIDGHPYLVRATVTEGASERTASAEAMIVPVCQDNFCRCSCDANNILGEGCGESSPDDTGDPAPGDCPVEDVDAGSG